nr:MAG TPA: hypothetical protein [Caudoviricetes sp.]
MRLYKSLIVNYLFWWNKQKFEKYEYIIDSSKSANYNMVNKYEETNFLKRNKDSQLHYSLFFRTVNVFAEVRNVF